MADKRVVDAVRVAVRRLQDTGASDADLLARYATDRDEDAFTELVRRHSGMVHGVARRVLAHEQEVEDVCQAVFWLLARKAARIAHGSVAGWLCAAARLTALNARKARARRARKEASLQPVPTNSPTPLDRMTAVELVAALDEELLRLPERYRGPLVLCYLEGLSRDEAALRVGVAASTLNVQLDRGRERLRALLARRGIGLGVALLAVGVTPVAAMAQQRIVDVILSAGTGGVVPPAIASLIQGSMTMTKVKWLLAAVLFTGTLGAVGAVEFGGKAAIPGGGALQVAVDQNALPIVSDDKAPANDDERQKALADFARRYALKPGEILKRVAPPFPPSRLVYHRQHYPNDDKAEDMMFLRWDKGVHFCGTIGGMKDAPRKVQIAVLLRHLPAMLGDYSVLPDGRRELDVRGDRDLLAEAVDGDWVARPNVPFAQIVARMGEILRDECKLPVRLTLQQDRGAFTLLVERQNGQRPGQAARQPSSFPSADYVLTEKDKDIPKPVFERIDYARPADCLFLNPSIGAPARIREVAASFTGTQTEKIVAIARWINSHLKYDDTCAYAWRDFDAIVKDGRYGGCADHAVVFGALLRACGIPCVWVKTMDIDWIEEFAANGGKCRNWRGHVFLEIYLDNRWMLLDATQVVLYRNYRTSERILPGRRYAYDKGANPYELILSARWETWKKQTAAHFLHFDFNQLPLAFQQGNHLMDQDGVFITTITEMAQSEWTAAWQHASERCRRLGQPVRLSFRGDYARLLPRTRGNYLVVVCVGDQFLLDEKLCAAYLPWTLADLRIRLGKEAKGCLHGKTSDGTRVALLFARDGETLRALIDELKLDEK
jgi:RNA polymerase sigma factor (sigma-70 family)